MPFLDLKVDIKNGNITTDLYVRDTDTYQYLHYSSSQHLNLTPLKGLLFLVNLFVLVACVHFKNTLRDTWLE